MKAYIIYLPKSSNSVNSAYDTMNQISDSFDTQLFIGVDKYSVWQEFIDSKLKIFDITRFGGGFYDSEIAAFLSHYKLWIKCVELNQNIVIFEHDANVINSIPNISKVIDRDFDLINLGKPNWGNRVWDGTGLVEREVCQGNHNVHKPELGECQCNTQWLFGAHSYVVSPNGARKLIKSAQEDGIMPADVFIRQDVVTITDLLPHMFSQKTEFTLIQRNAIYDNQKINAWDD